MVKKKTKTTAKKPARKVAAAPVAAHAPECACRSARVCWKKILIFILGIVIGAGASCLFHCKVKHGPVGPKGNIHNQLLFVDGCLDIAKVKDPEKLAQIKLKDADKNDCITREEVFGDERPAPRKVRKPRPAGN